MIASMIQKTVLAASLATTALCASASAAPVKLGVLTCEIEGGVGYVIGSQKALDCTFKPVRGGSHDGYTGLVSKLGIDVGVTQTGTLSWAVLALGSEPDIGAIAGTYVGVNAEASIATGGGANLLVGGFRRSIALQPLSVQAQTGINAALAVTSIELVESALK